MTHEQPTPPLLPHPDEEFGFTEQERLYDRISDVRFRSFLDDEQTTIHRVELSSNDYGAFLFVTVSRQAGEQQYLVTFYGLGYHDYRERWYVDEWFWYRANSFPETLEQRVSRDEVEEQLKQRLEEIQPYFRKEKRSGRAKLFEMLADLTDEDGAIAEMEDLGDMADWLSDGLE